MGDYAPTSARSSYKSMGIVPTGDAGQREIGDFARWHDALYNLISRVESLSTEMFILGNKLFGPALATIATSSGDKTPPPRCHVEEMDREIELLLNSIGMAETRFHRLRRLVSAPPGIPQP